MTAGIAEWLFPARDDDWALVAKLSAASEWQSLVAFLSDPAHLVKLWSEHKDGVMALWAAVEREGAGHPAEVYRPWLDNVTDAQALGTAGHLLSWRGSCDAALRLLDKAAALAAGGGDVATEIAARYHRVRIMNDKCQLTNGKPESAYRELVARASAAGLHKQAVWISCDVAQELESRAAREHLRGIEAEARAQDLPDCVERSLSLRAHYERLLGEPEAVTLPLLHEATAMCRHAGAWVSMQWNIRAEGDVVYKRDPDQSMALYEEGERICRSMGYLRGTAQALWDRAWLLNATGRFDEALAVQRERAALARSLGSPTMEERSLGQIATILVSKEKGPEAAQAAAARVEVCRGFTNRREPATLAYALCHLSEILIDQLRFDETEVRLKEAQAIGRGLDSWDIERRVFIALGVLRLSRGDLAGLLANFRELADKAKKSGNEARTADALNSLAAELMNRGHDVVALPILREASRIARLAGTTTAATYIPANLGLIHGRLGRSDIALGYFRSNERLARLDAIPREIALALMRQAEALEDLGRGGEAADRLREALGHARGLLDPTTLIQCLRLLVTQMESLGERDKGIAIVNEEVDRAARNGRDNDARRLRELASTGLRAG